MKAFTDISQSKKLAEILPLESADMYFEKGIGGNYKESFGNYADMCIAEIMLGIKTISCWSLTALLSVLPYPSLHKTFAGWRCDSYDKEGKTCKLGENADNPIDACVAMVEKLHKLNLL